MYVNVCVFVYQNWVAGPKISTLGFEVQTYKSCVSHCFFNPTLKSIRESYHMLKWIMNSYNDVSFFNNRLRSWLSANLRFNTVNTNADQHSFTLFLTECGMQTDVLLNEIECSTLVTLLIT